MMKKIFAIRREERWLFLALVLFAAGLCALNIYYSFDLFAHCVKGGFWSRFSGPHNISGYDQYTYVVLSRPQNVYSPYRHVLLPYLLYPAYLLNHALMQTFHLNFCQFIFAVWNTVCASYAGLFLYRILHEQMRATRTVSLLLTVLLFSFGHVMLTIMVADHFCTSMFLLFMAYYAATLEWQPGVKASIFWGVLFMLAAGVTLTNGCLVALASWYALGTRRLFSVRHIAIAFVAPLLVLVAATWYEYSDYTLFYVPKEQKEELKDGHDNKKIVESWIKMDVNRVDAVVENICGETVQLHQRYLLKDWNQHKRPMVVRYQSPVPYIIEVVMFVLFAAGLWTGRRERYLWLMLATLAFNVVLHLGFGFGLEEPYIFVAHWAIAVPVAYACLVGKRWLVPAVGALTVYLLTSNLWLLVPYFL